MKFKRILKLWVDFEADQVTQAHELMELIAELVIQLNQLDELLAKRQLQLAAARLQQAWAAPTLTKAQVKATAQVEKVLHERKQDQPPAVRSGPQTPFAAQQEQIAQEQERKLNEEKLRTMQVLEEQERQRLREQELQDQIAKQNAARSLERKAVRELLFAKPVGHAEPLHNNMPKEQASSEVEFYNKVKDMIYNLSKDYLEFLLEMFEANPSQLHLKYTYTQLENLAKALGAEVKQAGTGGTHRRFKFTNFEFPATKKRIISDPKAPVHGGTDGTLLGIYVKKFVDFLAQRFSIDVDLLQSAVRSKSSPGPYLSCQS